MLPVRGRLGQGYAGAAPTEWQYVTRTVPGRRGILPPLVYCHGSGDTALTVLGKVGQKALLDVLAQRYTVIAADLGLQAWGNATHVARITSAINHLSGVWGTSGKVTLVAGSMGALGALNYARQFPANVRCVAGIIPGLDLADLMLRGAAADINAAYPPAYDDATMGPTHSPVRYAASLDAALPIRLWTASNDTITVPATADAFVAARPQTTRVDVGALGHSEAAVTAAIPSVEQWLRTT